MATHPVEPDDDTPSHEPPTPNPTRLPVEPEFAPEVMPNEPEDPGSQPPIHP